MMVHTHVSFALMAGAGVWLAGAGTVALNQAMFPMYIGAVAIGSVFPDIDEPESYIGRRTIVISNLIKALFGHRGLTHSVFFTLIVLVALMVVNALHFNGLYTYAAVGFSIGWIMHSLGDMWTIGGVPILLPFKKTKYHIVPKPFRIYTGSYVEQLIMAPIFFTIFFIEIGILLAGKDKILAFFLV